MDYDFKVSYNEEEMKNYFKGLTGKSIKDTLIVKLKNTGLKGWQSNKGYFKCLEEKSNLFFEICPLCEDVYPSYYIEIVLNFPRIKKNTNSGKCFTTIQFVYKDKTYNDVTIYFDKEYNLFGKRSIIEEHIEKEEEKEEEKKEDKKVEEQIVIKKEEKKEDKKVQEQKVEKEEEKKVEKKEEKKEIPKKQEEIVEQPKKEENVEEKIIEIKKKEKKDDIDSIIKKFRSVFQFSKLDYPDEYVKQLLEKAKNDFQSAMMIHLDIEDKKKETNRKKVKNEKDLMSLVEEFREAYLLSKEDYSDEQIKKVLVKKEGDFNNAFEELMSFIE